MKDMEETKQDVEQEFLKFDELYTLSIPCIYLKNFEKLIKRPSKKNAPSLKKLESAFAEKLKELTLNLLGQDRIASIVVRNDSKRDDEKSDSCFFVGLMFGDKWSESIMRGPPANTEEGKKFRSDFGELSDIRKFPDNALCESVCWISTDENAREISKLSVVEKYMHFICYTKLGLPAGSLKKLFEWPAKWISPVSKNSPAFLQKAYHTLAKHLRKITVMELAVVGVNCVSSYYRDTEPFRLTPVPNLWRRSKGGNFYHRLNEEGKIPFFTPTVKVFITLETTGKWGKDPEIIESYKTACYIELAKEFSSKHRLNAIAKKESVLVLLNAVVFELSIIHDNELRTYQQIASEFSTDPATALSTMDAHEATNCQLLQSVSLRFAAFGEVCQVAKRWIASSNLSGHIDEIAIELLVAKGFIEPVGRSLDSITPMSVIAGFLQFLRLLASHNFLEEPVFVDINESLNDEAKDNILKEFLKRRPVLPCICISTFEDRSGTRYTTSGPEPIIMSRLVYIAKQAVQTISAALKQEVPINFWQLCLENDSSFDLTIRLNDEKFTRFGQINTLNQSAHKTVGSRTVMSIPVVNFDPTTRLVEEYRLKLGKYALFLYNRYRADKIFVLYRKNFRSPNKKKITECAKDFECIPELTQLHTAFKREISELGTGLVKSIESGVAETKKEVVEIEKPKISKRKLEDDDEDSTLKHIKPVIEVPRIKKRKIKEDSKLKHVKPAIGVARIKKRKH